jgi:phenylacetate-CoA ligase
VISSAGTLYDVLRQKMASVYGCPVYNHYGSREMHNIAMECTEGRGLHVSALTHLVEVLDDEGRPCPPGIEGDLVITSLFNRAMPFIRYRIGDRGIIAAEACACGRGLPLLAQVSGRRVDCFWTKEGRIVPGEYFIHLLGVHLKGSPILKYQVIQEEYDRLRFKLVLRPGQCLEPPIQQQIDKKTRLVMGEQCRMAFEYVDRILPAASGKYFYTICKIPDLPQPEAERHRTLDVVQSEAQYA